MSLDVEILDLVSKLGNRYVDEQSRVEVYVPQENPIRTLKAIRRILNRDAKREDEDADFGIQALAEVRSIQRHLIPLMLTTADSELSQDIVDEITKLLFILTSPGNKWSETQANELRLAIFEESKAGRSALALLVASVESALGKDATKRSDDDKKKVELLLHLVKNLLHPTSNPVAFDETLLEMDKEAVLDIILHFTHHISRKNNREWDLLLLEIYFYLFQGVNPDDLFEKTSLDVPGIGGPLQKVSSMKVEITGTLDEIQRNLKSRKKGLPSRHSHFGGVFVVETENDRKPVSSIFTVAESKVRGDSALPKSIAQRKRRVNDNSSLSYEAQALHGRAFLSVQVRQTLKRVADELLDKGYGVLFSTIIQDIRREDSRIKSEDEARVICLLRFFTRYSRLRGGWTKTSVMTTMDLWSFQFVVNRIIDHIEQKSWASLETGIAALLEMMQNMKEIKSSDEGKTLKNAVFYELRERLDIVPKLLKMWDPAFMSRDHLRNLTILGDIVLDILEDMAEEGAMAKAKSKALKRAERQQKNKGVFNLTWSAEESFALDAGVRERNGEYDLNVMRSILKDPALGSTFEDQKRTPQQLLARWMQIREALSSGKTLDQFVKEDMERQEEEDHEDEKAAENEHPDVLEKQVDFFAGLRSYLSNNIYRNFSRVVDPACHPQGEGALLRDSTSQRLVAKFYRRLRAFKKGLRPDDSLEPLLWHVENFDSWSRYLRLVSQCHPDKLSAEAQDLTNVIRSSLRRFFRMADKNKLLFTEALFWRTKQDNILISRFYGRMASGKKEKLLATNTVEDAFKENEEEMAELDARVEEESEVELSDDADSNLDYQDEEDDNDESTRLSKEKKAKKDGSANPASKADVSILKSNNLPSMTRPTERHSAKEEGTSKKKRSKENKNAKRKNIAINHFKLDVDALKSAVCRASKAEVTAEAMMSLVQAFEAMEGIHQDVAFVPPADLPAGDQSFEKKEMYQLLLCLGMRPPNRSLTTKSRTSFSCEVYWRILGTTLKPSQAAECAEALREAVLYSTESTEEANNNEAADVDWCVSEAEEESFAGGQHNDDEGSEQESDEDGIESSASGDDNNSEETKSRSKAVNSKDVPESAPKTRLRRVVSSDDEDDQQESQVAEPAMSTQKRRRVVSSDDEEE